MRQSRRGFTLIELLVVIAIIALLVAILLPALAKARTAGKLVKSMSNLKQINTASGAYREDNKGYMPLTLTYRRGIAATPQFPTAFGWCTWQFGGKNCSDWWAGNGFDVEAADRPLNPYTYPELSWPAPTFPLQMAANFADRTTQQAEVYKDPVDSWSYQRNWPTLTPTISSYDDVGTSYHFNTKWWDQLTSISNFENRFNFGANRVRVADNFQSSSMAWIHDQFADVIVNNTSTNYRLKNGYGDINKSVMAFLDGHASYLTVYPGNLQRSYRNEYYTFVFEDLQIPGN
jgi:prepilin-type N-terminal cleavage/methylation domain-containing protein